MTAPPPEPPEPPPEWAGVVVNCMGWVHNRVMVARVRGPTEP